LRPSAASSTSLSTAASYQSGSSGSSSSDFGDIGVDFSALRLSAPCARLVEFDLGDNHLVGPEGAAHIADSLRDNVALRELRLDGCGVGDDGAIFVAGALAVNGSLRELRLQRNRITECGAASLADAIKVWVAKHRERHPQCD
jgi:Ran GTPase-activating protein (RanGAP) involved in mRNA processing and transport